MQTSVGNVVSFVYGTFLGSFFNVCIFRIPRGTSIFFPRSNCPVCKETIRWWQNIPLLSYILLRGKCANCGSKISFRYFLIELASGFLVGFVWRKNSFLFANFLGSPLDALRNGLPPLLCDLTFVSLLLILVVIDLDFQIIPNEISHLGIAVGLACSFFHQQLAPALLAAVVGGMFFYSIRVVGEFVYLREAMGLGDVKLAAMLGTFLGIHGLTLAIFLSFPLGAIMATGLILLGLKGRKDQIPFGPAMAVGGFLAYFFGLRLIQFVLP